MELFLCSRNTILIVWNVQSELLNVVIGLSGLWEHISGIFFMFVCWYKSGILLRKFCVAVVILLEALCIGPLASTQHPMEVWSPHRGMTHAHVPFWFNYAERPFPSLGNTVMLIFWVSNSWRSVENLGNSYVFVTWPSIIIGHFHHEEHDIEDFNLDLNSPLQWCLLMKISHLTFS